VKGEDCIVLNAGKHWNSWC